MKVTKELKVWRFRGGAPIDYVVDIAAGLRVRPILGEKGKYWLDELPFDQFPEFSFQRHDATYYGIRLSENHVTEKE